MSFKKIVPVLFMVLSISMAMPASASNDLPATVPTETPAATARLQVIMTRLTEIRDMDKTNLTTSERKDLKKEVKAMKKEVNEGHRRGVFLSVGAIIIIILLLILLL